jgi:hypothetical protein
MGILDRLRGWAGRANEQAAADPMVALVTRREAATEAVATRGQALREAGAMNIGAAGFQSVDADDYQYRRLSGKQQKRDLTPIQQDKMLEIAWFLWEQNPFARRLITLMTDLVVGDGVTVRAVDPTIQDVLTKTWEHPTNKLNTRLRSLYNAATLNGELILPVSVNDITGRPVLGFIDPWQVQKIETLPDNAMVPDVVVLKADAASGESEGRRLKIVREDPATGWMEGEVFYFPLNALPNSSRGRSDLMPLADWLDLYDQYLFSEVERLNLLSAFVWDYKIEGATPEQITEKLKNFPTPRPGSVFGHNEKETLEARTPDLKAQDRSEVARMLRVHIGGSAGFPLSYLGETDSNRATIEGQNDVLMKTPAARQRELASLLHQIATFAVQQAARKNPALFRGVTDQAIVVAMPEIAVKDVSRAGNILAGVASAMDTAMANKTISRKAATEVICAVIAHLGVELKPQDVLDQIGLDAEEDGAAGDAMQAAVAAARAKKTNPPVPGTVDETDTVDDPASAGVA